MADFKSKVSATKRERLRARSAPSVSDAPPLTLDEIYAQHSGFVWRMARRMGVPEHAVEDVMHEVFVVVDRRLDSFDGSAALTTWLYHQTRGVVSNYRRRDRREQRRIAVANLQPVAAPDPEAEVGRKQAAAFVQQFLDRLDPAKREVFELVELEGVPVPEVAQMVGIKLNTAYSRLRLARASFAKAAARFGAAQTGTKHRSRAG